MNHHGLFIKLMHRRVPVNLLQLVENRFTLSVTCVKWGSVQCMSQWLFAFPPVIAVVNKASKQASSRLKRKVKFLTDCVKACNSLCTLFACVAQNELYTLL